MEKGFEVLEKMEYPGRIIIIGKSPAGDDVVMYAITGGVPRARRAGLKKKRKTYW